MNNTSYEAAPQGTIALTAAVLTASNAERESTLCDTQEISNFMDKRQE